ncbi:hypothetical protein ACO0E1_00710 [Curtobacterium sp. RRHDQ66]
MIKRITRPSLANSDGRQSAEPFKVRQDAGGAWDKCADETLQLYQ